jgi:hypothetical protein
MTLTVSARGLSAQTWSQACAELSDGNCSAWSSHDLEHNLELGRPDCFAKVKYRTRTCAGPGGTWIDVVIISVEVEDGCGGWDNDAALFHLRRDSYREYVSLGLLHQLNQNSAPNCNTGTAMLANVYTAACGIWLHCEYTLPNELEYTCEQGWQGPAPHFGTSPKKVRSSKWQSCGEVCCRRRYSMCWRVPDPEEPGGPTLRIQLIGKERLGDCTGQSNYVKPCSDGC